MGDNSSSSQQSNRTVHHYGELISVPNCGFCGQVLNLKTSWTNDNPGRRYWECSHSNGSVLGCGFIKWFDPPMCSRSKKIIPGLLRRINRNEEEIESLRMKIRAVGSKGMSSGKSSVNLVFTVKVVFIWTIILVLAMCYYFCSVSRVEVRGSIVKMLG